MSAPAVGDKLVVGNLTATVRRVVQSTRAPDDAGQMTCLEVALDDGRAAVAWHGQGDWRDALDLLADDEAPASLRVLGVETTEATTVALLQGPPPTARPFEQAVWRGLDTRLAVAALQELVLAIGQLHTMGLSLGGVRRSDLYLDPDDGRLALVCAPRIELSFRPTVEDVWRDQRIIGELAYEAFMDHDYPGGHQMAALLQDRAAMAETGLLQAGLTQVVAGCVSPYGELAFQDAAGLWEALEQLRVELEEPLRFEVGSLSTVGNYIFRRNNQDACGHIIMDSVAGSKKRAVGFFCVADGIGGIQDGERASRLAVEAACLAFGRAWSHYGADGLGEAPGAFARAICKVASQRLVLAGEFDPRNNRGGTTFTGVLVADGRAGVCHVGDSRAVLVRDGQLIALTQDHTLAGILAKLGEPSGSPEEAETSNRTIARFLSTSLEIEQARVDGFAASCRERLGAGANLDDVGLELRRGDILILTSDGVHEEIDAARVNQLASFHRTSPQELCNALVQHALSQVGRDNATALAVVVR